MDNTTQIVEASNDEAHSEARIKDAGLGKVLVGPKVEKIESIY